MGKARGCQGRNRADREFAGVGDFEVMTTPFENGHHLVLQGFELLGTPLQKVFIRILIRNCTIVIAEQIQTKERIECALAWPRFARYRAMTSRLCTMAASWVCFIVPVNRS